MKSESNRLTLRGANALLKRALELRARREKMSLEKMAVRILEDALVNEKSQIEYMDSLDIPAQPVH